MPEARVIGIRAQEVFGLDESNREEAACGYRIAKTARVKDQRAL